MQKTNRHVYEGYGFFSVKRLYQKTWIAETQSTLEKLIDDPKHRNPKLMALRRMIGDYFKENPDARVIVFVKTRELVKAIETYMKETEELRILNPIQFVGVQANKERGGKDKNWCFKVIHCTVKWFSFFWNE